MEQASCSFMAGIRAFSAHLPLTSLLWPFTSLRFFFQVKPVSLTFWIMVVLSAPFNPQSLCVQYLPLQLLIAIYVLDWL